MNSFIAEVSSLRPAPDRALEQYQMTPESMERQVDLVGDSLRDQTVFFLGDDDFMSPLLAEYCGVKPVLYELDERVRETLVAVYRKMDIDFQTAHYDAREPLPESAQDTADAFYLNPPYSSKSEGAGIRVWLKRALFVCGLDSRGVLVMPWDGGNITEPWVDDVQQTVTRFLGEQGLSITRLNHNVHAYEGTAQAELRSSNLFLSRDWKIPLPPNEPASVIY